MSSPLRRIPIPVRRSTSPWRHAPFPPEAGYREDAEPGAQLRIDGQPIERRRLGRVALARLRQPLVRSDAHDPWTVNLVLSDGVVRVAKLGDQATAGWFAETLAAALGVGYDPAEIRDVVVLPGHPFSLKVGLGAAAYGMAVVMLAVAAALHHTAGGWAACSAVVLVLDLTLNDLWVARKGRRMAAEEARVTFGVHAKQSLPA